jgi:hypothetical protein
LNTATAFTVILVLNVLWFGAAFRYFSLTPNTAAKLLVPKSARESPLFSTIAASVRFLGGMNLAFAAVIKYVREEGDPPGKWVVEVALTDQVRGTAVPLKAHFNLQMKANQSFNVIALKSGAPH